MSLDLAEIKNVLEDKRFEDIIGEFENEWLECKVQPYDLSREDQKLELAKDITSLANAEGGILLLGYSTKRTEIHGEDQIYEVRGFPEERFRKSQYESVLATWVYPPIDGLEIIKYRVSPGTPSIIVCITVPKAVGPNRPVLVAKSMLDNDRKVETIVGYFVRKQSHVAHYDVERIHAIFRDGLRYDANIRENFSVLHNAIESLRGNASAQPPTISEQEIIRDVDAALRAAQLQGKASIVLTAVPCRPLNLTTLFDSNSSRLVKLIESPPEVRSSGFNLGTGERSKIIKGKSRRAVYVGSKLIEVHRSGVVIFISDGAENGLCWGRPQRQQQSLLIKQIAHIEIN
jgi:hypothetical protein